MLSILLQEVVRIIARRTLRVFWEHHADSEEPLKAWHREASKANWNSQNEINLDYPSASIFSANREVFNIKGNRYRLITKVNYEAQIIWIRFIGTHAAYDRIDANTI